MKYVSLILLVIGLLLTVHGVSVIEGVGFDVARFLSNVEATIQILPLAVGIVFMVTSIAGFLPASEDATPHFTTETSQSFQPAKLPD